jgi:hypothetical protein
VEGETTTPVALLWGGDVGDVEDVVLLLPPQAVKADMAKADTTIHAEDWISGKYLGFMRPPLVSRRRFDVIAAIANECIAGDDFHEHSEMARGFVSNTSP